MAAPPPSDPRGHRRMTLAALGDLGARARAVLDGNWTGASTVPSRQLYPHQWNWDSAFIAIGRSWDDEDRARQELMSLVEAQWADGRLPHIVFNPAVAPGAYFPGPGFWRAAQASPAAPRHVATSGITQPPLHARAALELHRHARDVDGSRAFLRAIYPRLVAQHRYLDGARDLGGIGLPAIVHPWESGLDNSPAWDRDLAGLEIPPGAIEPYQRHDVSRVAAEDRPTDAAYDAFVFLATRYRDAGYDDARALAEVPFAIAGPMFVAIHLWSTHAMVELAEIVGADPGPHRAAIERLHDGLIRHLWDAEARRFYPWDLIAQHREPEETIVSFAPVLDPDLPSEMVSAICADLASADFHPAGARHHVVPSYGVGAAGFDPHRYWRGPIWINTNWLLWSGLRQHDRAELAAEIALDSLELIAGDGFREYFDPIDGEGRGSDDFGWTAALAIDFIERALG